MKQADVAALILDALQNKRDIYCIMDMGKAIKNTSNALQEIIGVLNKAFNVERSPPRS